MMNRGRVLSEDVSGLDFAGSPAEVDITTFNARPVADLAPDAIPPEILHDIERAIIDHGWRAGVRGCTITIRRGYTTQDGRRTGKTRMIGKITYA